MDKNGAHKNKAWALKNVFLLTAEGLGVDGGGASDGDVVHGDEASVSAVGIGRQHAGGSGGLDEVRDEEAVVSDHALAVGAVVAARLGLALAHVGRGRHVSGNLKVGRDHRRVANLGVALLTPA